MGTPQGLAVEMRGLVVAALLVASCLGDDCDNTFPDGSKCPHDNAIHRMADPTDCTSYWWCADSCPAKKKCERNYLFSPELKLCTDNKKAGSVTHTTAESTGTATRGR